MTVVAKIVFVATFQSCMRLLVEIILLHSLQRDTFHKGHQSNREVKHVVRVVITVSFDIHVGVTQYHRKCVIRSTVHSQSEAIG